MTRKYYWGLASLILLVIGVSAVLLLRTTDTDPIIVCNVVDPLDAPDTWQGEPVVQPAQAKKTPTYTGPLTFHDELLKINPVKALRLQAEERGHWSAQWIPPFPPDDTQASAIAKNIYLLLYYDSIGKKDTPERKKAHEAHWDNLSILEDMPFGARVCDLMMLLYYDVEEDSVLPFYMPGHRFDESGIRHEDRIRRLLSNYFPLYFSDIK